MHYSIRVVVSRSPMPSCKHPLRCEGLARLRSFSSPELLQHHHQAPYKQRYQAKMRYLDLGYGLIRYPPVLQILTRCLQHLLQQMKMGSQSIIWDSSKSEPIPISFPVISAKLHLYHYLQVASRVAYLIPARRHAPATQI